MLKIRLRRMGKKKRPYYRVVVSDSRTVPGSAAVEEIGHYNPTVDPVDVKIDAERVNYWVGRGAQVSPTVKSLMSRTETA